MNIHEAVLQHYASRGGSLRQHGLLVSQFTTEGSYFTMARSINCPFAQGDLDPI